MRLGSVRTDMGCSGTMEFAVLRQRMAVWNVRYCPYCGRIGTGISEWSYGTCGTATAYGALERAGLSQRMVPGNLRSLMSFIYREHLRKVPWFRCAMALLAGCYGSTGRERCDRTGGCAGIVPGGCCDSTGRVVWQY